MSHERRCEGAVDRWSRGPVGLPQLDELPDSAGLPPEALPTRDLQDSSDLIGRPLLHVPEKEEVPVSICEVLHPSADLGPFVERVDQALAKSLMIL